MTLLRLILLSTLLLTTGCGTVSYYSQAITGHTRLMCAAEPVDELLANPETPDKLREQLALARQMREFAINDLHLPDNGSYRKFVQLDRPVVLWNVLATPELSLEPVTTCAPVAGCVAYRNYYSLESAKKYAGKMKTRGNDTYIGGVTAYSTIGWFRDPLVSSMMNRGVPELAGVIFHELAHQQVYAKSDTAFSESFATVVETEGLRRWLQNDSKDFSNYRQRQQRYRQFVTLIMKYRQRLQAFYRGPGSDEDKRSHKQEQFAALVEEYSLLKKQWQGYDGFDRWMLNNLNNAKLASIGNYHGWVPHLQKLLANSGNDLPVFYRRAEELAKLKPEQRRHELEKLLSP